jgi:antirestriction protein ArdC
MPNSTKQKRNPQADLTRKVLQQMKEHGANWVKPWKGQMANGSHHNCVTGNYYTGGNVFLAMDSRRSSRLHRPTLVNIQRLGVYRHTSS